MKEVNPNQEIKGGEGRRGFYREQGKTLGGKKSLVLEKKGSVISIASMNQPDTE